MSRVFRKQILYGGKSILFSLVGEEGACTFTLEQMPDDLPELLREDTVVVDGGRYMGMDWGYHVRYDNGWVHMEECVAFDGAECWYSGSSLIAIEMGKELARHWDEGMIHRALEAAYVGRFGNE